MDWSITIEKQKLTEHIGKRGICHVAGMFPWMSITFRQVITAAQQVLSVIFRHVVVICIPSMIKRTGELLRGLTPKTQLGIGHWSLATFISPSFLQVPLPSSQAFAQLGWAQSFVFMAHHGSEEVEAGGVVQRGGSSPGTWAASASTPWSRRDGHLRKLRERVARAEAEEQPGAGDGKGWTCWMRKFY